MQLTKNTNSNYTVRQLKLPLEIEKIIDISDPVYTFCDVMDHIDLSKYFVEAKGYKTGRPRCDAEKLLKFILFAFMEHGFCSLRDIEKLCRTEEIYECEDCSGCPYKNECCKRTNGNRTARLNRELTAIHHEVIDNLESIHGALLRMNRSIQVEGTFGVIKWDRAYKRLLVSTFSTVFGIKKGICPLS